MTLLPLQGCHTTHGSVCDTDGQAQEKEPQRCSRPTAGQPRWEPETGVRKHYFWCLLSMFVAQSEKPNEEHSSLLFRAM